MALAPPDSRILVAQAPLGRGRSGGGLVANDKTRVPIGVVEWPGRIAVVAKLTFSFDPHVADQEAEIAHVQRTLSVADKNEADGATAHELTAAHDFARYKPQTDVLLVGSAFAAKAERVIAANIVAVSEASRVERSFTTVGPSPIERMPLLGGYLRDTDGESATSPVGATGPWILPPPDRSATSSTSVPAEPESEPPPSARVPDTPPSLSGDAPRLNENVLNNRLLQSWLGLSETGWDDDSNPTSYVTPQQRSRPGRYLEADAAIQLTGLCTGGGPITVRLPGFSPWIICETRLEDYFLETRLDTLTVHTEENLITAVWRAQVPLISARAEFEVNRLIVTLERDRDERPLGVVYRDLQRGQFFRALEEQDVRGTATDWEEADEDLELELEQYDAFDMDPEPTITIEQYAQITAELAASPPKRSEILREHDFTEEYWILEDQGWLERIGEAVTGGDFTLAERYRELYQTALRQLTEGDS